MFAETAVPAAVRMPRSAAGQRALVTLVFLGGLLGLAVIFGGGAHAAAGAELADRTEAPSSAGLPSRDLDGVQPKEPGVYGGSDSPAQRAVDAGARTAEHRQPAGEAAGEVATEVIQPVRESDGRTERATRPVGEAVQSVSDRTRLSTVTDRLVNGTLADRHGTGHGADRSAAHGDGGSGDSADKAAHRAESKAAQAIPHTGTHSLPGDAVTQYPTGDDSFGHSGHGPPGPWLPQHQLPSAPVTSVAAQFAGDGNGSRGGPDQLAAYVTDMERFDSLLPGAVRSAQDGRTRERAGEILEFPG